MHSFSDLPIEVIANIYRYLDIQDILSAEQTCHQWLQVSQLKEFTDLIVLKIIQLDETVRNLFMETCRKFSSLHLKFNAYTNCYSPKDAEFARITNDQLLNFFSLSNITYNIEYLTLENIKLLSFSTFCEILKSMPNLKELKCKQVKFIYSLNEFFFDPNIWEYSTRMLNTMSLKLQSLCIENCEPLQLFQCIKNLKQLHVLYNESIQDEASFETIVKNNESSLKSLKLESWTLHVSINWGNFTNLSELKLKEFYLSTDYGTMSYYDSFLKFLKSQKFLTDLCVININKLNNKDFNEILEMLPNIQKLNFSYNKNLSSVICKTISNLMDINSLTLNGLKPAKKYRIFNDFVCKKKCNLLELRLLDVKLADENYISIAENLSNLKVLHGGNGNLTDNSLYCILKNCKNIVDLVIHNGKVTDNALIGPELQSKKLLYLSLQCEKISDETLTNGFKFENLTVLSLLITSNMSAEGFKQLTDNCLNIKVLTLRKICSSKISLNFLQIICIAVINFSKLKKLNVNRKCVCMDWDYEIYLFKNSKKNDFPTKFRETCTCDFRTYCVELLDCWKNPSFPFYLL
ncbi:uncharacterized protein LOC129609996 [Condylostylus longicornis]|uniref:uncharacterized protein LOC129609996 n=1 Tax=Condylostylus longicornis TaxID=2530218 RepID=UPI00244E46AF|nr:uncharacterized protein LOC129609996 [Condylostylus longicornis]